jgi:hypothetical protein
VREIPIAAGPLVTALTRLPDNETVCFLDSCGVGHLGSHLLIAGIRPTAVVELAGESIETTLNKLDELSRGDVATVFSLSYDFGRRLQGFDAAPTNEPDVFAARFPSLIVHD